MGRPGRPPMAKPTLHKWVDSFLDMLTSERNAAENTRSAYWRDLADVSAYLKSKCNCDLNNAGADDLKSYLKNLADKDGSKAVRTVARRLSALRQFYGYLVSENLRSDDPTSSLESPKQGRILPKTLSEEEVDKLITAASTSGGNESTRLVCLIEMLYATGLRVSELVGLSMSSIGENGTYLTVAGKGNKERVVPLTDSAQKALENYLIDRERNFGKGNKWLFPSRTSDSGHITRQRFAQLLKELSKVAQVDSSKVSPHVLRHAFATHLLSNGADLRAVQKMLGHADIATTQIYTHILGEKLKKTVEEKHPLSGTATSSR